MKPVKIDEDLLRSLYLDQEKTVRDCAKELGISESPVRRRLKKLGIDIRPSWEGCVSKDVSPEVVLYLYFNQKKSISQTAKEVNKSEGFVRKTIKRAGKSARSLSEGSRIIKGGGDILDEEIIRLHDDEGWSCERISRHLGMSDDFARQRFLKMEKDRRSIGFYNKQRDDTSPELKRRIFVSHARGDKLGDILSDTGLSVGKIYHILHQMGFVLRDRKDCVIRSQARESLDDVVLMYENGMSSYEIARCFGCSDVTVGKILKEGGVEVRDGRGENSHNWKGGVSGLHNMIRQSTRYGEWRTIVFERDNYTCQISGIRGGRLEAHHCNVPFRTLLQNFLSQHPDLDPMKDTDSLSRLADDFEPFWDISNGITLSRCEHNRIGSSGQIIADKT